MKKSIPIFLSLALGISYAYPCFASPKAISTQNNANNSFLYNDATYTIANEASKYKNGSVYLLNYKGDKIDYEIPEKVYLNGLCYEVVKIDAFAFANAQNTQTITIPSSVLEISNFAFASSPSLTNIEVKDNINFSSVDGVLFSKDKTNLITFPTAKVLHTYNIPLGTKTIKEGAFFENKNLKTLIAPSSLETIEKYAFSKTSSLKEIKDIINVKTIGDFAFANSSISSISLSGNLQYLGESAFYGSNISSITIPHKIGTVPKYCFYACSSLKDVYFSEGVYNIDNYAFANSSAKNIEFSKSLTSIGEKAFLNCDNLKEITLGENIEKISNQAFENCSNLEKISFSKNLSSLGNLIFKDCPKLTNIDTKENIYFTYENSILYSLDRTELVYMSPDINQRTLSLPKNISKIREDALTNIDIVEEFTVDSKNEYFSVENGILYNKNKTKLIRYPSAKETVNFTLPKTVKEIAPYAFKDAKKLIGIIDVSNISKIANSSFKNTPEFSGFYIEGGQNSNFSVIDNILYNKDKTTLIKAPSLNNLKEFKIPNSVKTIGSYAFEDSSIETLDTNNVTKIEGNAFLDSKLNTISMPKVETIGVSAFRGTKLKNLELPKNIKKIDDYAFADCKNLEKVDIKANSFEKFSQTVFYNSNNVKITVPTLSYKYYKKIL